MGRTLSRMVTEVDAYVDGLNLTLSSAWTTERDGKLCDVLLKLNSRHRFRGLEILRAVRVESHKDAARQELAFCCVSFIAD